MLEPDPESSALLSLTCEMGSRIVICKFDRELRMFHGLGLGRRCAPLVAPARRPFPILGASGNVSVIHLKYLGGVLNDDSKGIDKRGEDVVARPMTTHAPSHRISMVRHPSDSAH